MVLEQRNFKALLEKQWLKGNFIALGLSADIEMIRLYIQADHQQRELLLQKAELKKDKEKQRVIIPIRDSISDFDAIMVFNRKIIEATWKYVCAFVIDLASFDECEQSDKAIRQVIDYCRDLAIDVPVIIDGEKTGNAEKMKSHVATLTRQGGDAMTVSLMMGKDALLPLLQQENLGAFVLCRTSNPEAADFQNRLNYISRNELQYLVHDNKILETLEFESLVEQLDRELIRTKKQDGYLIPYYQLVALHIRIWNFPTKLKLDPNHLRVNCGAVVGVTVPNQLRTVRQILGDDIPILIPDIGKQGGDLEASVAAGLNKQSTGILINASRSIIFAAQPGEDYARAAHDAVKQLHDDIQRAIAKAYAPN